MMARIFATAERAHPASARYAGCPMPPTMRGAVLLLPTALSLTLASCDAPTYDPAVSASSIALAACSRNDVQDIVGKETRSKMLKAALPRLLNAAMMGLVDINQVGDEFSRASVSFYNVALADPATQSGPPFNRVVCSARLQLDLSDAVSGQQIIGIERLRWVVNFSEAVNDPATGAFTVDIDALSIQSGLTVNGQAVASAEQNVQQGEPENAGGGSDTLHAGIYDSAEDAADAAREAAEQAARELADANAALKEDSSSDVPAQDMSTDRRKQNSGQSPSDEELYAPHN